MTSPMVDTVRNIPLVVEKDFCVPMSVDQTETDDDSGFPFDRDFEGESRDESFRSQLDDIAKRHPEIAEHLEGFPFRSETLGRRTRPPRAEEPEFRRFTGRPFGSARFERFGFPFGRDPFEDEYERFEEHKPQEHSPPHPQPQTEQQQQPQEKQPEQKKTPERGRNKNIQQSNTVDLGQKQEPVNDRNQRSMSAPPPDNRSQQRFVSSINIPVGGMGDMGGQQSQQQSQPQQEKPANKPTERVIPIHVEGRDEPVMPKHAGPTFSQPQPQPERIFGHRPSQFTQYVGPRQYSAGPEWHHQGFTQPPQQQQQKFQQQQTPPPQQQQQQKFQQQQTPPPQPQQQQQSPKPQEQDPPPPPQPQRASGNPIEIIQLIQKDVSELMSQVEKFSGAPKDKQYLYLDEMLTRNLIKLDNIDTQGQENIRQARKEAIKCIEGCIGILEAKAAANVAQLQQPETKVEEAPPVEESQPQPPTEENMEVDPKETPESGQKVEEKQEIEQIGQVEEKPEVAPPTEEKMEVEASVAEPAEEKPELKADEDIKVATEDNTGSEAVEETSQQEGGDDKKETKKGKKKVVKK